MMIRVMCLFSKRCRDMRKKAMFESGFLDVCDMRWRAQAKTFRKGEGCVRKRKGAYMV